MSLFVAGPRPSLHPGGSSVLQIRSIDLEYQVTCSIQISYFFSVFIDDDEFRGPEGIQELRK